MTKTWDVALTNKEKEVIKLLDSMNIQKWEITDKPYGVSLKHGPLKTLLIWDRFIFDASPFEALGYGVKTRSSTFSQPKCGEGIKC